MIKKIVSFMLFITFILSALSLYGIAAETAYPIYDITLDSQKLPVQVPPGSYYGQRIKTTVGVTAVTFSMPTWTKTDCSATIGVFEWKGSYDKTIQEKALYSRHFPKLADNASNKLEFDSPLQPGEYFFAIYEASDSVGIWRFPMTRSQGFTYMNGSEEKYDLAITLFTAEKTENPVEPCNSVLEVSGDAPAYDQLKVDPSHPTVVRDAYSDTWVVTDGLGREISASATDTVRNGKTVGLFYWSWHNDLASGEPLNVNDFILQYPEAKNNYNHKAWPRTNTAYFWNEPVFGYYRTTDRWVLRKHAEMLASAGVDVIFFDNTNGSFTWRSSYSVIFDVFKEAYDDGVNVPKISFLLPFAGTSDSAKQLREIYLDIYRDGRYRELWFYLDNKPMLMAHTSGLETTNLDKEIRRFFTFRSGQPEYSGHNNSVGKWGWLSVYPQDVYYAKSADVRRGNPEQITVGVAQNSSVDTGLSAMNGVNIRGRSYTSKDVFSHLQEENSSLYGYNFSEQWEYALEVDPSFVFITGWNEWTAGRQKNWNGVNNAFPDQFNDEYSRDIEPTKGPLKDHYYYQMVSYIRKYKGSRALPEATDKTTVNMADLSAWNSVGPYYVAYKDNIEDRNSKGYGSLSYTDESGRNDITGAKIARDNDYIYIYIECAEAVTQPSENWMTVYLDTVQNGLDGWESFDYVINKKTPVDNTVTVERFTGNGYETEAVGDGEFVITGNTLQIKVKRTDIGIMSDNFTLNFKITDNVSLNGDIMNFYTSGDVAPTGRFKYSYISTGDYTVSTDTASELQSDENNKKSPKTILIASVSASVVIIAVAIVVFTKKQKS